MRVFGRRGIGEGRHAEIAEEAGVAVSTVFVYFPSREALVDAVLDQVALSLVAMARTVHQDDSPAPVALRAHIGAFLDFVAENPDLARVWMDWSTSYRDDIWPRYEKLQERIVTVIAATIGRGQKAGILEATRPAEELARLMVASAHMLAQLTVVGRDPSEVSGFVDTLLYGLGVRD